MRRRILIVAMIVVLLLAFAGWWFSPTQVVQRRCDSFFNVISFREQQAPAARHAQGLKLADYLDRDIAISANELPEEIESPVSRGELQALFSAASNACNFIAITDRKFESIGIAGEDATVQARVKVAIGHPEGDHGLSGTHRVMLSWHRTNQVWVLTNVAWEKIAP